MRPLTRGERLVVALPGEPGGALAAGVCQLHADLGEAVAVHELDDTAPGRDMLGLVHSRAARRDAPLPAHVRHLRHDEAGAAERAAAEMDEMPIVDRAVLGRVLAHGGDDDAVLQHELAQAEGREHGWGRIRRHVDAGLVGRLGGEPAVDLADEGGIAQLEVLVTDAQRAREQAEGELDRLEPRVIALAFLEPALAHECRALQRLDLGPVPRLVVGECGGDVVRTRPDRAPRAPSHPRSRAWFPSRSRNGPYAPHRR